MIAGQDAALEQAARDYLRLQTPASREGLCEAGLPLVRRMAVSILRRLPPHFTPDDLIGDGCVGLLRAIDRFDPQRGMKFELWAARLIRGAILNGLRAMDIVPERVRRDARLLDVARWHLAQLQGTAPKDAVAAVRAGLTKRKLNAVQLALRRSMPLSLDMPPSRHLENPAKPTLYDRIDSQTLDPAVEVAQRAASIAVHEAVCTLPPREQHIIRSFYSGGSTFRTIGGELGISKQRVSQIHGRALQSLRAMLAAARIEA
jgi:RNA polymerase sigma factor FliA